MVIPFDGDAAKRFVRWLFMLELFVARIHSKGMNNGGCDKNY